MLVLEGSLLDNMRDTYSELDHYMMEYEILLEQTGLPYCDYKVYDSKRSGIRPI